MISTMMTKQIRVALTIASLAVALVVLNVPVVKVFAQGTNQTLEKGGLETMLKKMIGARASMAATTGATAGTHKIVIGIFACPANFTSIERQCDIFLLH
jgi:ABC-type sulfate transport system permease subunit